MPPLRLVSGRVPGLLWGALTSERLLALVPVSVVQQHLDAGLLMEIPLEQELPFRPQGLLIPVEPARRAARALAHFLISNAKGT